MSFRCVINIDASHIRPDDDQRKYGRAMRGKKAYGSVYLKRADGKLVSVLAAMTIEGFDMDCCEVVAGAIDYERHSEWVVKKVGWVAAPAFIQKLLLPPPAAVCVCCVLCAVREHWESGCRSSAVREHREGGCCRSSAVRGHWEGGCRRSSAVREHWEGGCRSCVLCRAVSESVSCCV